MEDQIRQEGSFVCRDGNGGNGRNARKVEKTSDAACRVDPCSCVVKVDTSFKAMYDADGRQTMALKFYMVPDIRNPTGFLLKGC